MMRDFMHILAHIVYRIPNSGTVSFITEIHPRQTASRNPEC